MKQVFQVSASLSIFLLAACGQTRPVASQTAKNPYNAEAAHGDGSNNAAASANTQSIPSNGQAVSASDPAIATTAEEPLSREALPPVAVGGAFLDCLPAGQPGTVGCQLKDQDGVPKGADGAVLEWASVSESGAELPLKPKAHETKKGGTYYFMSVEAGAKSIRVSSREKGAPTVLDFKNADLNKGLIARIQATPIEQIPKKTLIAATGLQNLVKGLDAILFGTLFGSAVCQSPILQSLKLESILNNLLNIPSNVIGSLFADTVCNLQSPHMLLEVQGPVPFKPIEVLLTPDASYLQAFGALQMPSGSYTLKMKNTSTTAGVDSGFAVKAFQVMED